MKPALENNLYTQASLADLENYMCQSDVTALLMQLGVEEGSLVKTLIERAVPNPIGRFATAVAATMARPKITQHAEAELTEVLLGAGREMVGMRCSRGAVARILIGAAAQADAFESVPGYEGRGRPVRSAAMEVMREMIDTCVRTNIPLDGIQKEVDEALENLGANTKAAAELKNISRLITGDASDYASIMPPVRDGNIYYPDFGRRATLPEPTPR